MEMEGFEVVRGYRIFATRFKVFIKGLSLNWL